MKKLTHRNILMILLCLTLTFSLLLSGCQNPTPPNGDGNEQTPGDGTDLGDKEEEGFMTKDGYVNLTDKGNALYDATYQTMLDRLMQDGYAQTSLTGAYDGMFVRDASIQVMAHVAQGDLEAAKRILQYMATYHMALDAKHAIHIMNPLNDDLLYDYVVGQKENPKPASGTTSQTVSQLDKTTGLYLVMLPNNQAAQEFTVPFDSISEISVALVVEAKKGTLKLTVGTDKGDDSVGSVVLDIAKTDSTGDWVKFTFDEPLKVEPGQKYFFTVSAENTGGARVVAYGKAGGGGAYNYDVKAYGGWQRESHSLGYQIRTNTSIVGEENAAEQQFVAQGDRIDSIDIDLDCAETTTVYAELTDASGKLLKQVEAEATTGKVTLDFGGLTAEEGKTYTLTVWAESGRVNWTIVVDANGKEVYAHAISPEYSGSRVAGSLTVGGDVVAAQTLTAAVKKQYVTSAALYLAAVGTVGEKDTFTVSLYKGDVLVDEQMLPLSMLGNEAECYTFEFCLPIEKTNDADDYTLRLGASREGSVKWFGIAKADASQKATLNGEAQDVLLSYTVGCSKVEALSQKIQVDGHYMWMNSFALFALEANKSAAGKYDDFIRIVYPFMAQYAEYFFEENGYLNDESGLMYNPSYEHSRDGRYWQAYDLITNVFSSEAMHKMGQVADIYGTEAEAAYFTDVADELAEAIHEGLTCDFKGKTIYTELIAVDEGNKVYKGFSFVNLAPLAADWYAMDEEIMKNTYEAYRAMGTDKYGKYSVLGVVIKLDENENTQTIGDHVIGKGLAWELFYLWKTGDVERLEHLVNFVYDKSTDVYPEVWCKSGSVSDSANQEHANWILYSFARITGKYKG